MDTDGSSPTYVQSPTYFIVLKGGPTDAGAQENGAGRLLARLTKCTAATYGSLL